jgi:mycoredoxin
MQLSSPPGVTVYWRPGCPFCTRLQRDLARLGIATTEVNIWEDPDAAGAVRSVAGGNETVPTVMVGERSLVNPSAANVVAALRAAGLDALPNTGDRPPARDLLQTAQWVVVGLFVVVAFALEAGGHSAASWASDAVAALSYVGIRLARRRRPHP